MNKVAIALLFLIISIFSSAETKPGTADHNVNVHVGATYLHDGHQQLEATIDGRKYRLESLNVIGRLLALGDYKAKLVTDEHKNAYDSFQTFEFEFPDKKLRKFMVTGLVE
ncbi:MAG TPA: hypothetical protein VMT67_04060 [Terriglobales bacterium]|nr:hypothetical protein [Terriglobales bacterium]